MSVQGATDVHSIDLPKKIVVGDGVIERVGTYLKELGITGRILIVTGPVVKKWWKRESSVTWILATK